MHGLIDQSVAGDAHRRPRGGMGRTGPRNVVALRLRGHPPHRRRRPPDERGPLDRHHLPDARAGLPRRCGASAPQIDHLVRFAGRGDRRRGAGGSRPRFLPRPYAQLAGQLHRLEAGMGRPQRAGAVRPGRQVHAPGRLHRLPPLGPDRHQRERPLGADSVGFRRGAPRRLRRRPLRHSARDDPRGGRLDRHAGPHRRGDRAAAGHPRRDPDFVPRGRPAQQRLLAQCDGGGRDRRHGRHERRGIRRGRHASHA